MGESERSEQHKPSNSHFNFADHNYKKLRLPKSLRPPVVDLESAPTHRYINILGHGKPSILAGTCMEADGDKSLFGVLKVVYKL